MTDEKNIDRGSLPVAFDDFLNFDSLLAAEEITGKSYKDDDGTSKLGIELHMMHARAKQEELGLRNDSYYGMKYAEYIPIVEGLGFELAFEELFSSTLEQEWMGENIIDSYRIYWRDGLLLTCESYRGDTLNSSSVYFNAEFETGQAAWSVNGVSGYLHSDLYDAGRFVWVGSFSAREGLRHTLSQLETYGTILSQWIKRPMLLLNNYGETGADTGFVTAMKLAELPKHVQAAIPEDEYFGS